MFRPDSYANLPETCATTDTDGNCRGVSECCFVCPCRKFPIISCSQNLLVDTGIIYCIHCDYFKCNYTYNTFKVITCFENDQICICEKDDNFNDEIYNQDLSMDTQIVECLVNQSSSFSFDDLFGTVRL